MLRTLSVTHPTGSRSCLRARVSVFADAHPLQYFCRMERGVILLFRRPVERLERRRPPPFCQWRSIAAAARRFPKEILSAAQTQQFNYYHNVPSARAVLHRSTQIESMLGGKKKKKMLLLVVTIVTRIKARFVHCGQSRKTRRQQGSLHFLTFCSAEKNHLLMRTGGAKCPQCVCA